MARRPTPPAWPDPDASIEAAKLVADLYSRAVAELLKVVAARLARGIDQPGWAEAKLGELARLREEAIEHVRRLEASVPGTLDRALVDAWHTGQLAAMPEEAASMVATNRRAVDRLAAEVLTPLAEAHRAILRITVDAYRTVIADTAAASVVTGAASRRQAAQAALDRFADRGIAGFVDRAGRRWELTSYAEMATRTAAGRAHTLGTLDRLSADGRDLVIVSDHGQECHLCRPWEGRILSITGMTPGYVTVAEAQANGLHHPNCRHALAAYVPGLTRRPAGPTADPDGDQLRQRQRYLERGVRRWRRREAVAITPEAERLARRHRQAWQARLTEHVEAHDLKRLRYREQIRRAI